MGALKFRKFYLFFILAMVGIAVGATSIYVLYNAHTDEELERLSQFAKNQARLFEAVSEFDSRQSPDFPGGSLNATKGQFEEAFKKLRGFGDSGELILGIPNGDRFDLILSNKHSGLEKISISASKAGLMQRAVSGQSGSAIALDYRGEKALAAFEPIRGLNYGIVIKVDIKEHRKPFVQAGVFSLSIGLIIILTGGLFFFKETEFLITSIENKNASLEEIIKSRVLAIEEDKKTTEMLKSIAEIANFEKQFDTAIEKSLKVFCNYLDWEIGHIYKIDHSKRILISKNIWHLETPEKFSSFKKAVEEKDLGIDEGLVGKVVSSQKMIWVEDINKENIFGAPENNGPEIITGMAFPITLQKKSVGILEFYSTKRINIRPELKDVAENIGNLLGQVFERQQQDQIKTEFISIVAHELRTPLTSIRGYSELLMIKSDANVDEKEEFLGYINKEAIALTETINDLLDISRIESNQGFLLSKKSHSIKETFEDNIEVFQGVSKNHKFTLTLDVFCGDWLIDKDKMRQVLNNIYSNAIKYSPKGGLIETFVSDSEQSVVVSIKDQGIGMSSEDLDKIFVKFYRVDSSNTSINGTGLGANIMKYLIEAHGGKIIINSELGKGTEVVFNIPKESCSSA